jgi:hypothetical protein
MIRLASGMGEAVAHERHGGLAVAGALELLDHVVQGGGGHLLARGGQTVCESSDHLAAAANRPSLLPKYCMTRAGSTPAAAATARMVARS